MATLSNAAPNANTYAHQVTPASQISALIKDKNLEQLLELHGKLSAAGRESDAALVSEAITQQVGKRKGRKQITKTYDIWIQHEDYKITFKSAKDLMDQMRRCVHGDQSGKNNIAAMRDNFLMLWRANEECSREVLATKFAAFAVAAEADHNLAIRNSIGKYANEIRVRELVAECGGDYDAAKTLSRGRSWAPVYVEKRSSREEIISASGSIDDASESELTADEDGKSNGEAQTSQETTSTISVKLENEMTTDEEVDSFVAKREAAMSTSPVCAESTASAYEGEVANG